MQQTNWSNKTAAPKKSGKKKKTEKLIPVQTMATARRVQKAKGRGHAGAGRKVKDVEARKKMIVNDSGNDAGILYHTLPKQKIPVYNSQ